MIKSLDCPIVNPTLGGSAKVKDITSASLSPDRRRFIAGGPADQVCGLRLILPLPSPLLCPFYSQRNSQAWPDPWVHVFNFDNGVRLAEPFDRRRVTESRTRSSATKATTGTCGMWRL
eukprot:126506-Hanusia_phi.AAC.3